MAAGEVKSNGGLRPTPAVAALEGLPLISLATRLREHLVNYRSDLNAAWTSVAKSSGCSHVAK